MRILVKYITHKQIHENVVRIYESYEDARNIYLVMDYCDGGTLYQKILERHVLTM